MSDEQSKKDEKSSSNYSHEVQKGNDAERSGFEKGHSQDRGNLSEGYQPVRDVTSPPPDGGSGVPDKSED